MTISPQLSDLLNRLEGLLASEHSALIALDHEGIEQAIEQKQQLFEQLEQALATEQLEAENLGQLKRVRSSQLKNQLLLVHARDSVRGALNLAIGLDPAVSVGTTGRSNNEGGVRLNIRG